MAGAEFTRYHIEVSAVPEQGKRLEVAHRFSSFLTLDAAKQASDAGPRPGTSSGAATRRTTARGIPPPFRAPATISAGT